MKKALIVPVFLLILITLSYARDSSLEAVGFLGGQNLYYLFTSIGLLADSYYGNIYDGNFARNMAGNISVSARKAREIFRKLPDSEKLSPDEQVLLSNILSAYESIINEADAFQSTLEVTNQETRDDFERYKDSAWAKIRLIWKPAD
jgi:hypothetical protein